MRIAVVYSSTTGFTRKYAIWIAEALEAKCHALNDMKNEDFEDYDFFVYGGSLHAVGITGLNTFKERISKFKDINWTVFAVGATPVREDVVPILIRENLTLEERDQIRLFYFRGGFDYDALKFKDKLLMKLLKLKIKMKPQNERTPDEKGMINVYDQRTDFTQKKSIEEIVNYVKTI